MVGRRGDKNGNDVGDGIASVVDLASNSTIMVVARSSHNHVECTHSVLSARSYTRSCVDSQSSPAESECELEERNRGTTPFPKAMMHYLYVSLSSHMKVTRRRLSSPRYMSPARSASR